MKPIVLQESIAAPRERVFAIATDIENTPQVFSQIVRVEMIAAPKDSAGLSDVGTRWKETRKAGGREATVELAITQRRVPESFRVSCEVMGTRFDTDFVFASRGSNETQLTLTTTATPRGLVSRLMTGMMGGMMAKGLREDVASLKRAAEGRAAAVAAS